MKISNKCAVEFLFHVFFRLRVVKLSHELIHSSCPLNYQHQHNELCAFIKIYRKTDKLLNLWLIITFYCCKFRKQIQLKICLLFYKVVALFTSNSLASHIHQKYRSAINLMQWKCKIIKHVLYLFDIIEDTWLLFRFWRSRYCSENFMKIIIYDIYNSIHQPRLFFMPHLQ